MTAMTDSLQTVFRYHAIQAALDVDARDPADRSWLQLGALAAVTAPIGPDEAAASLSAAADEMIAADGGSSLASGTRFQIAGALTQDGVDPAHFNIELKRLRALLHTVGVEGSDAIEATTVLIMLQRSARTRLTIPDVTRVGLMRRLVHHRHWWQQMAIDAPVAATLASCRGQSRDIEAHGDCVYTQLTSSTHASIPALRAAAAILAAAPLSPRDQLQRFSSLFRAFGSDPRPGLIMGLAMLAPLDEVPADILDRYEAISDAIHYISGFEESVTADLVTGGLCYLSLSHLYQDAPSFEPQRLPAQQLYHLRKGFNANCCLAAAAALPM